MSKWILCVAVLLVAQGAFGQTTRPATQPAEVSDEQVEKLVLQLSADRFEAREEAERELLRIGERARASLEAHSKGSDAERAMRSQGLLKRLDDVKKPQVILVSMYAAPRGDKPVQAAGGNQHTQGQFRVNVAPTEAPMVLVLCAYDPVKWDVRLQEGANVSKIIISGYEPQALADLPVGVPVEIGSYSTGQHNTYFYLLGEEDDDEKEMLDRLKAAAGREPTKAILSPRSNEVTVP